MSANGSCIGHADRFDLDILPGETTWQRRQRLANAEATCARCPVLAACRRWAQSQPTNSFHGVVAGQRFRSHWYPKTSSKKPA
ncbi:MULTISPECIES: WhiB family transcriptional regulator [Mycobacteriales]|uniref:WhiB family transcriptional regulator n=1 Tax=Gordonia sp. BP-94 TaxID=2812552 RepID=UPI001484FB1E